MCRSFLNKLIRKQCHINLSEGVVITSVVRETEKDTKNIKHFIKCIKRELCSYNIPHPPSELHIHILIKSLSLIATLTNWQLTIGSKFLHLPLQTS